MNWSSFGPQLQSVLRMVASALFMLSGTMLLFAFPAAPPGSTGPVPVMSQMGIGGILELVGGGLLLIGYLTRPVAFILSGMMAVAYFQFHYPSGFWPTLNGGSNSALFCYIWLFFSAAGAGPWSVDAMLSRSKATRKYPSTGSAR